MTKSMFDLSGKVAVVSGAAQGLGQATAIALAEHGADVVLVDRNLARALKRPEKRSKLLDAGFWSRTPTSPIRMPLPNCFGRSMRNLVESIFSATSRATAACRSRKTCRSRTCIAFCRIWSSVVSRCASRRDVACWNKDGGSIMNIGSLASSTALGRGHIAYSMAMGAVLQMTRELSTEWSHRGVRVNCVTPAQVTNPSLIARMQDDPTLEERFLRGIPAGRLGMPDDIKGLAVLLASDASEWITGAIIPMDGGNIAMNAGGSAGHLATHRADVSEVVICHWSLVFGGVRDGEPIV